MDPRYDGLVKATKGSLEALANLVGASLATNMKPTAANIVRCIINKLEAEWSL